MNLNAHITLELEKLANTYKSTNDTWRAVGYQRAITAIRNYDKEITSREVWCMGDKIEVAKDKKRMLLSKLYNYLVEYKK